MLKTVLVPINRAGWPFIAMFAVATIVFGLIAETLGWIGVILTLWCVYFFRDPDRITPQGPGLVISPADGVVQFIDKAPPPPELEMGDQPRDRVCIFMNVFDVHVNRVPCDGKITKLSYRPGKFFNASLDKASEFNERQSVRMTVAGDGGGPSRDIAFVQIAGLVARRIICQIHEDQAVKAGERFGLIRFGSRVDVYMPDGAGILVAVGQRSIAGETVIADLSLPQSPRPGEIR